MEKRNWKIYYDWIDGKDYDVLAQEYNLAPSTIKEICTSKVPDKIKQTHWQTANQYKKWREWLRKKRQEEKSDQAGRSTTL
jgi:hypothetical protein